ncbi:MAG: heme exporter protein CcmB [Chloroflexi bacterium]|nr:heme exporter protein CcmB [Chloroflexota bacterium]
MSQPPLPEEEPPGRPTSAAETRRTPAAVLASAVLAVFRRECLTETRQWQALSAIFMFGLISLSAVSVGLKGERIDNPTLAAELFWIVLFFTAMTVLSRSFVREEDARTAMALRLSAPPLAVYLGKLAYNLLLMVVLDLLLTPGFLLLVNRPVDSPALLLGSTMAGALGLAAVTTILGAMAARAGSRSALFAVVAFPLILPLLVPGIHAASVAFGFNGTASGDVRFMVSYSMMCVVAAILLFPTVWSS